MKARFEIEYEARARSSVVERSSYTRLVAGSIPAAPTMICKDSWGLSEQGIIVW